MPETDVAPSVSNLLAKVKKLGLSSQDFIVVGGATLVVIGLIEWDDDIDLAVTPKVFETLKNAGWQTEKWQDKTVLKQDIYDAGVGFGEWTLEDLQSDALLVADVAFMSLTKLRAWKINMGREKDLQHVALIDEYLNRDGTKA